MSLCCSALECVECPANLYQSITKSIRCLASVRTQCTTPALYHVQTQECLAPEWVSTYRGVPQNFALPLPSSPIDGKIQFNPNPIVCTDQKLLSENEIHKLVLRTNDMRIRKCVLTGTCRANLAFHTIVQKQLVI